MTDGLFTFGTLETVEIPALGPEYAVDTKALAPVGVLYRHKGNVYRYVLYKDPAYPANPSDYCLLGEPVYWLRLDPPNGIFEVCSDPAVGLADINGLAGIGCSPSNDVVDGIHYWIKVGGVAQVNFIGPSAPDPGDKMIGCLTPWSADHINIGGPDTDNIFGVVQGAEYMGLNPVLLQNLMW